MSESNPEIPLGFTQAEWNILLAGLYELPLKHSGAVAARLQQKLAEAQRPKPLKEARS